MREFDGTVTLVLLGNGQDPEFPARIQTGDGVYAGFTRETTESFVEWVNRVHGQFGPEGTYSATWDGDDVVMTLFMEDPETAVGEPETEVSRVAPDEKGLYWIGGRMFMWDTPEGV